MYDKHLRKLSSINIPAMKLSSQDKKDLHKFTRFFALKASQIIVQSRLGQKDFTPCKQYMSSGDWFNLSIQDIPEVLIEARKVLNNDIISSDYPLCVEISLRTVEGDHMVLESWCLGLLPELCDPSPRIIPNVYNRIGLLLKSLVSVTRVTPAYKLSRSQGPESYVMCYRVYMDQPQLHTLGDGYKQVRVGQICTPIGTLQLSVAYRTKMTISPTQSGHENSIMLKSDHFNTNLSPKNARYNQNEEKTCSLSDKIKVGAFADLKKTPYESDLIIIPNVPFSKLLVEKAPPSEPKAGNENQEENDPNKINTTTTEDRNGNSPTENTKAEEITMVSTNDDFIMVDLKTPFASTNSNSELNKFFRECQTAPPLQTFTVVPTIAEQVEDLTKQLETFELDVNEYDTMVQSLCLSPNNN